MDVRKRDGFVCVIHTNVFEIQTGVLTVREALETGAFAFSRRACLRYRWAACAGDGRVQGQCLALPPPREWECGNQERGGCVQRYSCKGVPRELRRAVAF